MVAGLLPVRRDAEPPARLHQGRLRRPDAGARCGTRSSSRARPRASATRRSPPRSSARCASWRACGIDLETERQLHEVDVWTSHEGLLLDYEEALTPPRLADRRLVRLLGAHALDRRADAAAGRRPRRVLLRRPQPARRQARPDGDDRRGVGSASGSNPTRMPGRLTLVARMGADRVARAAAAAPARRCATAAIRSCGSATRCTPTSSRPQSGCKTRRFDAIMGEIEGFFAACRRRARGRAASTSSSPARTSPSASAAAEAVLEEQLDHRYETLCDPRLNARQSLDLAFRVAELMRAARRCPAVLCASRRRRHRA